MIFRLILVLVFTFMSSVAAAATKEFKFTAIPDQDTARLQQRFNKVADYLTETLGFKVTYIPVKTYAASVQAFKNNDVQMAWFGGLSGVQARLGVPGSVAVAQGEEDNHFVTYFIAHHSTKIEPTKELTDNIRGKSFTFGSKSSTSGRLMPEFFIREKFGQSPDKLFSKVGFSGDHSKTIALVQSGSYQIGAVNYKVWEKELQAGTIDLEKVSVIWKTPHYPDYNWSVRGDVEKAYGKDIIAKIQQSLVDINDPELLNAFPRKKFIPAENSLYEPIFKTGQAIGFFR